MTPSRSSSVRASDLESALEDREGAVQIALYVQPRASRTKIVGMHDGRIKIALAAPPVDGKANQALVAFLANVLDVARAQITLASGASGRRKRVAVEGLDAPSVARRLAG